MLLLWDMGAPSLSPLACVCSKLGWAGGEMTNRAECVGQAGTYNLVHYREIPGFAVASGVLSPGVV